MEKQKEKNKEGVCSFCNSKKVVYTTDKYVEAPQIFICLDCGKISIELYDENMEYMKETIPYTPEVLY